MLTYSQVYFGVLLLVRQLCLIIKVSQCTRTVIKQAVDPMAATAPGVPMAPAVAMAAAVPAVVVQPGIVCHAARTWMPVPAPIPGVPPGLEYLAMVDTVNIYQEVEPLEFLGFETANRYRVTNALNQQLYYAVEQGSFGMYFCDEDRPFIIHMIDNAQRDVMLVKSPNRTCACCACCTCCERNLPRCFAEAPPGYLVSTVQQQFRRDCCSDDVFEVFDAFGRIAAMIRVPDCTDMKKNCPVLSLNGGVIGCITKHWSGFMQEMLTDADTFSATFPVNLDVNVKAGLLAATFLIDFLYFEDE